MVKNSYGADEGEGEEWMQVPEKPKVTSKKGIEKKRSISSEEDGKERN